MHLSGLEPSGRPLSLKKIRKRVSLSQDTLNYFLVKDLKFARFCLLPKIHKRLCDVSGRPVTSYCGFCTENISSFLDVHLHTNHFLKKIKELGQLPKGTILCTIDVVYLYPNIPHDEGLAFLKDFLGSRVDKQVTTDTLIELGELVLKNNIFEVSDKPTNKFAEQQAAQSLLHHMQYFLW